MAEYEFVMEEMESNAKELEKLAKEFNRLAVFVKQGLGKERKNEALKDDFENATEENQNTYYTTVLDVSYDIEGIWQFVDTLGTELADLGIVKKGEEK